MTDRPRVSAEYAKDFDEIRSGDGTVASHGLSVRVEVDFALHDHERALDVLEQAYKNVVAQIAEVEISG